MSYLSGNGGELVADPAGVPITLHINKWTLRKASRNVDNTHSNTTASNYEHVVPDHGGTVEIPWDDTNIPDTDVGLAEGARVTLKLFLGSGSKFQTVTNTIVESCEDVNDNGQDIIRTVVTFKGGTLTRALT
jgi:hypothetical protein